MAEPNILGRAEIKLPVSKNTKNFVKFAMKDERAQENTICAFPFYTPNSIAPHGTKAVRITVEFLDGE